MEMLGLLGLLVAFACIYLAVRWILGPLDRAAKNRLYPIQFTLADFLCLFVQVQLALAAPATLFREIEDKTKVAGITAVVIGLVLLVWWTGVRTLSRAGVHGTLARALTLTVTIPFGYAFSIGIPFVAVVIFLSLVESPHGGLTALLALAEPAMIALAVGMGLMTRRILATAQQESKSPPPNQPMA